MLNLQFNVIISWTIEHIGNENSVESPHECEDE
jgi:hypothetical protein